MRVQPSPPASFFGGLFSPIFCGYNQLVGLLWVLHKLRSSIYHKIMHYLRVQKRATVFFQSRKINSFPRCYRCDFYTIQIYWNFLWICFWGNYLQIYLCLILFLKMKTSLRMNWKTCYVSHIFCPRNELFDKKNCSKNDKRKC